MFYFEQHLQNKDDMKECATRETAHTHTHTPFNSNRFHSFISFNKPNNASRQEESAPGGAGGILFWDGLVPLAPSAATYFQPVGLVISAPRVLCSNLHWR